MRFLGTKRLIFSSSWSAHLANDRHEELVGLLVQGQLDELLESQLAVSRDEGVEHLELTQQGAEDAPGEETPCTRGRC